MYERILQVDQKVCDSYSDLCLGISILSVHRHVINVYDRHQQVFSFVDAHIPRAPRQLRVSQLPSADEAHLCQIVQQSTPTVFCSHIVVPSKDAVIRKQYIDDAWDILQSSASPCHAAHEVMQQTLQSNITHLLQALEHQSNIDAYIQSLIGLGLGLTPSGDDFLSGFLIACHLPVSPYRASLVAIKKCVEAHLHGTHPLSAAFLQDALDGEVNALVQDFIDLIYGSATSNHNDVIRALTDIGQRSGYDMLSGLLAGLPFSQYRRITLCPYIAA